MLLNAWLAAEAAGLAAGDILLAFDGEPVTDLRGYSEMLKARAPGDRVVVAVRRGEEELELERAAAAAAIPPTFNLREGATGRMVSNLDGFFQELSEASARGPEALEEALAGAGIRATLRQVELAAPLHLPCVGAVGRGDPERHVADQLLVEARLDLAGGQPVALPAGQRRGVDPQRDRERRLVDADGGEGAGVVGVGRHVYRQGGIEQAFQAHQDVHGLALVETGAIGGSQDRQLQ